jgi:phosphate starvation-inducible PhoH-like protein
MKTFLTRLGPTARLVVTGDITQVDLPNDIQSGLVDVQSRLLNIKGIEFVRLDNRDIVRHRLVRDIVNAYQKEAPPEVPEAVEPEPEPQQERGPQDEQGNVDSP